ncbi:hypothetical protein [Dyella acidisoli]|uniref:Uncharacterized protein n=1 Tax=Dyella acidisoli TaxID=1867834 RepID=A0ABQ5XK28_9GAMM|nr:hypothetical protein [Dyella acidisoli]GLQ91722.1 hypothetical protein GCM10007901_06720 [Dyella acidisoli]
MLGLIPNPAVGNFQGHYQQALAYLRRSQFASQIIQDLENAPQHIGILVQANGGSEYIPPYRNRCPHYLDGGLIVWNYTSTMNTTDFASNDPRLGPNEPHRQDAPWLREQSWGAWLMEGVFGPRTRVGQLSEAMGLLHEMGHAMQYLTDAAGFQNLDANNLMELENLNVSAIEATVAQELRSAGANEGIRWDYQHQGHYPGGNAWPNWLRWIHE